MADDSDEPVIQNVIILCFGLNHVLFTMDLFLRLCRRRVWSLNLRRHTRPFARCQLLPILWAWQRGSVRTQCIVYLHQAPFSLLHIVPFGDDSLLIGWPWWHVYEVHTNGFYMSMVLAAVFLSLFVGAILLRSWWALLIVPPACAAGWIVPYYILWPLLYGWDGYNPSGPGWSAVQAEFESGRPWTELGIIIPLAAPLIFACAALGAWVGVSLSQRLKKHEQHPSPKYDA